MTRFYDWNATLSRFNRQNRQALLTMVVGGNGIGKTYGLRKWLVKRFIETGETFCEITRHATELPSISGGWFDKIEANNEFPDKLFRVEACTAYIADKADADEGGKVPSGCWEVCGYFVALSRFELVKRTTYVNVRCCVFDEFILDRSKPNCRYMRNEFSLLMKICVAVFREIPGDNVARRIIMMANAVDMINPYFAEYGISKSPYFGYHWYDDKRVLLHFVEPWDAEKRKTETTIGLLTTGRDEQAQMFDNVLFGSGNDYIKKKPSSAKYMYGITYEGSNIGFWRDTKGNVYATVKTLDDAPVFALTTKDNSIDVVMAKRTAPMLKGLCELYYMGMLYYESPAIRGNFEKILLYLGIR